jgi:hypothetical protein
MYYILTKKNKIMKRDDIESVIEVYKLKSKPEDRYTSFDYCYNYFRTTTDLNQDLEKSCLVLGFYLASWGMYRGSSFLLQHSVKHFQRTIEFISTRNKSDWEIDVDNYTEENMKTIIDIYREIKTLLIPYKNADLTLITKVLLGVFGFIPAFDNNFCDSFRVISKGQCGFRSVNKISLGIIHDFYMDNKISIDNLSAKTFTKDFISERKIVYNYPKAKIIDMYGFIIGQEEKTEKVFEILGEGGGICISREINKSGAKFIYHLNEFDPTNEGLDINKKCEYDNFEEPFQLINDRYPWYLRYLETVHDDYKNFIIERLIEKLNDKSALLDNFEYHKGDLENFLKIELNYRMNRHTNKLTWSYEKIK